MSSGATAPGAPQTKSCIRCRVPINATSDYCTLCGAVQRGPRRWLTWVASIVVVLVIAGIAVGGGLLLGGSSSPGRPYTLFQSASLITLVPRGWEGGPVAAPPASTRVVFSSSTDPTLRMTVTAARVASGTAVRRGRHIRAVARALGGFHEDFFGRIFFPGMRPAVRLTYESDGYAHVVYVFSVCAPAVAMTVDLRALRQIDLQTLVLHVPSSATARC